MKLIPVLLLAVGATGACLAKTINFDRATTGPVPAGWVVAMTHTGGPPEWKVVADDSAPSKPNVLAQLSTDATKGRFPIAIYDKANLKQGTVSAKFKAIAGTEDQAAGLVWRYKDPDNYYVVRANALEDNVVLYKVENGRRTALAPKGAPPKTYGVKHKVPKLTWCTLAVTFQGELFTVTLNGEKLFEVEDATFAGAGKVGLWTKADSVTHFDDFRFTGN